MAQFSTSISDLMLALSCVYCLKTLTNYSSNSHLSYAYSKFGFVLIMTASSLGVFRFGMSFPPTFLTNCHQHASFLASVLGMSCLAAEFYQQTGFPLLCKIHMYVAILIIVLQYFISRDIHSFLTECVSSLAVISTLVVCVLNNNIMGCAGAIALIVAGLILGRGTVLGFPSDDFFHYALVLANWCLVHALTV